MWLENWAQQLVNAATIGGMYTLVAIGFTLFFGVLGLINFAHGEVFMLGAFAALLVARLLHKIGVSAGWVLVRDHVRRRERVLRRGWCGYRTIGISAGPTRADADHADHLARRFISNARGRQRILPRRRESAGISVALYGARGAVRFGRRQLHADCADRCLDLVGGGGSMYWSKKLGSGSPCERPLKTSTPPA